MASENTQGKRKVTDEAIEKKMRTFNNSQDSVQALSLWIMHHKAHHRKIVDVWLKVLSKSGTKHRLNLMYLCNDVVQHAKRKKALYYLEAYKKSLQAAVSLISEHDSIKPNVRRIFNIWEQRNVYDKKFVKQLQGLLDSAPEVGESSSNANTPTLTPTLTPTPTPTPTPTATAASGATPPIAYKPSSKPKEVKITDKERDELSMKIVAEFKPPKFIECITNMKRMEGEVELRRKQLSTQRIDATSVEAVKQLKDRSHGNEFCKQFEESCVKIEEYVSLLEKEIVERNKLLEMSTESEIFYDEQCKEARIVANAYRNFGARITNMKKKVDDLKKSLPSTPSPVPSPSADAPSPGNTPPLQQMDDNETVDMEMSDEEGESSKVVDCGPTLPRGEAYTATVKSIPQPIPSLTGIKMRAGPAGSYTAPPVTRVSSTPSSASSNVLESRIANMLPTLARGNSTIKEQTTPVSESSIEPVVSYTPPKPVRVVELTSMALDTVGTGDQRASTPVMDEQEEKSPQPISSLAQPTSASTSTSTPSSKEHSSSSGGSGGSSRSSSSSRSSVPVTRSNPIDFLSQLLTKKSSSSSSNFLQGLSLLTNTVKTQIEQQKHSVPQEGPGPVAPPLATQAPSPTDPANQADGWAAWKAVNQPIPPPPPPLVQTDQPPSPSVQMAAARPMLPQHNLPMHMQHAGIPPQGPPPQPPSPVQAQVPASQAYMQPHAGIQPPSPNQPGPNPVSQMAPVSMASAPVQPVGYNPSPMMQQYPLPHQQGPPPSQSQVRPPIPGGGFPSQIMHAPGPGDPWEQNPNILSESPEPLPSMPAKPLPPPPKGILRKRNSSLKEVTLVDQPVEDNAAGDFQPKPPSTPPTSTEKKPPGILKKPFSTESESQSSDVQSEFIAKLKRKTALSNLVVPPIMEEPSDNGNMYASNQSHPNLTTILPSSDEATAAGDNNSAEGQTISVLGNQKPAPISSKTSNQGEPISTIGVVGGAKKRNVDVYGGEMEIDEEPWPQEDSGWGEEEQEQDYSEDSYYDNTNEGFNDYYRYRDPETPPYRDPYYSNPYPHGPPPQKRPFPNSHGSYYRLDPQEMLC